MWFRAAVVKLSTRIRAEAEAQARAVMYATCKLVPAIITVTGRVFRSNGGSEFGNLQRLSALKTFHLPC